MSAPLYILEPGRVRSRTDGDIHYITALQLARLYGVPLSDCVVNLGDKDLRPWVGLPVFRPRYDGNYPLFQK